jgi:hypothetical protein
LFPSLRENRKKDFFVGEEETESEKENGKKI